MTRAKQLLFLIQQQLQPPSYSNIGTYEWNGEENLPPQLVLSHTVPECALKKALGDDGKYYYYVNQSRVYGNGSIRLHDSIAVPKTGITEVSIDIEILNLNTGTHPTAQAIGFVNSGRKYISGTMGNTFYANGVSGLPTLTIGKHTLKQVIKHASNTIDVYFDNIIYGTSISQYSASITPLPTCDAILWSASFNLVRLNAFRYMHTE